LGLSKIDFKILHFICLNGIQMPESEIANQLRLKPSTVSYSIKKMCREKIILGYRYRINYARLGLPTIAWVLLKVNLANADSLKLLDDLLQFPQIHVVSFLTGEFDIAAKVVERNVFAVDSFVRKLSDEFKGAIDDAEVLLATRNFKAHNIVVSESSCLPSFDETDFKILNSKMLFPGKEIAQIAAEHALHRNTVSKRWRRLWRKKVVVKKTPVVNPEYYKELSIALKAIVLIDATPAASSAIAKGLVKIQEVHELNSMLGRFALMAIVRTAGIPEFLQFLDRLQSQGRKIGGLKKTVSILVLRSKPHPPNYLPQLLQSGMISFKRGKLQSSKAQ